MTSADTVLKLNNKLHIINLLTKAVAKFPLQWEDGVFLISGANPY